MREMFEFEFKYKGIHAVQTTLVRQPGPVTRSIFVSQITAIIPLDETDDLVEEFFSIAEEWQYSAEVPINTTNPLIIAQSLQHLPDVVSKPTLEDSLVASADDDDVEEDSSTFKPYVFSRFLHNDHVDTIEKRVEISDVLIQSLEVDVAGIVLLRTIEGILL